MGTLRIAAHGMAMALINIGAILAGFLVYTLARPANQLLVQLPLAIVASWLAIALWLGVAARTGRGALRLQSARERLASLAASLLWSAAVFLPLHYATQGYPSAAGNIFALWAFQVPVNALALFVTRRA